MTTLPDEQTTTNEPPTHCAGCGQQLLLRHPGRDTCHRCAPPEQQYAELRDKQQTWTAHDQGD